MKKQIILVGGGFAGLQILQHLSAERFDLLLIDKNNFNQFQPLLYQVALAQLDVSNILFPFRNFLKKTPHIRYIHDSLAEVNTNKKYILTQEGLRLNYDSIVFAMGTVNNFFGNSSFEENTLTLKSIQEAGALKEKIFGALEKISTLSKEEQKKALNWSIIGAGPTGIEVAILLKEMIESIFKIEYPAIDFDFFDLRIIESSKKVLSSMSQKSSDYALKYLKQKKITVLLDTKVVACEEAEIVLDSGERLESYLTIWTAGVRAADLPFAVEKGRGNRVVVTPFHEIIDHPDHYCIGDQSIMTTKEYPDGHPQLAQVAMQQAVHLAKNLNQAKKTDFVYINKGEMAVLGKKNAVVDIGNWHFHGLTGWLLWSLVHIWSVLGTKNKIFIFLNWVFFYISRPSNLRFIWQEKK